MPDDNITQFDPNHSKKISQGFTLTSENTMYAALLTKLEQFQRKVKPFQSATLPQEKDCTACLNYLQTLSDQMETFKEYVGNKQESFSRQIGSSFFDYYSRTGTVIDSISKLIRHVTKLRKQIGLYYNFPSEREQKYSNVFDEIVAIQKILPKLPKTL